MEKTENRMPKKGTGAYFTSFLNRIGGVFLAPDATFNQIIADKIGFWEPLILVLALVVIEAAVLSSLAYRTFSTFMTAISPLTGGFLSPGFLSIALLSMILVTIVVTLIFWVIVGGIAHLSAKYFFNGTGSFVQLMKLYGYSFVPYSLVILSTVLIGISWVTWPVSVFLNIVTTFWFVLLMVVAVKHNYEIDIGKAFISSFIGPMVVWLIMVSIFWVWILAIIASFTGGFV
jgi:hypothetical protein